MPNIILQGVVGSTAYGLAREGSDVDRHGVFTVPPKDLLGLDWSARRETIVRHEPDSTHHELGKFFRLLLNGNPTVNELLWLDHYEHLDYVFGNPLVSENEMFLSQQTVKRAYLGYATDQYKRAEGRNDGMHRGSFSSDTKGRSLKHARHCLRLLEQARRLWREGFLFLQVEHPEEYFALDDMPWDEVLATMKNHLDHTEWVLNNRVSALAPTIDRKQVADLLDSLRAAQNWYGPRGEEIAWGSSSDG